MSSLRSKIILLLVTAFVLPTLSRCASLRTLRNNWFSPVSYVISNESALRNKTHLVLTRIKSKNIKPQENLTVTFRDNLRFELLRAGFTVDMERAPAPDAKDKSDDAKSRPRARRGLILRGYIFEARTGELLDEETTTGVYLAVDVPGGGTAAHMRYIGDTSLSTYAAAAEVGRLFAKQLKALTQAREEKAWWKFW